jgi:phage N-6-adenine-methyltransferase
MTLENLPDPPESEVLRKMPLQKPGKSKQDYATPMEFIRAVEGRFGTLRHDLAAHEGNHRCETFFSPEQNSLVQPWAQLFPEGNLWLNPPYSDIGPWAKKCAEESIKRGGLILFLTPASIGSEWFADHVEGKALVLGLRPRLSFDGKNPYPKDCILSVYGIDVLHRPLRGFETWRWK